MVKFLAIQIKLGKITIEQIPERYRNDVSKELGLQASKVSGTEYVPPMKLIKGRKYFQNGITYKCTVSSGIEVNNDLASLVGIYVEIVNS